MGEKEITTFILLISKVGIEGCGGKRQDGPTSVMW